MQNFKVCVSNLPKDTNEERLNKMFCDLDFIKITLEKTFKGECKGFGFVEFGSEMEMNKALEMNGLEVDGKRLRISKETEDLCEFGYVDRIKKRKEQEIEKEKVEINEKEKEIDKEKDSQKIDQKDELNKSRDLIHQQLDELSKKMNSIIFSKCDDPGKVIPVELSSNNPQLICELKHLFEGMDEKEFKQQIARNDELKRIYLNCCSSEQVSTEHKLCKIQYLKFDENPLKDEQLKELCSVLVKGFEGTKIDFNICNLLTSNITSLNIVPERAIVFELTFDNKILGDHTFKELVTDKRKQKVIEMNLQKKISEVLEIPFGEIVFVKIREGSVKFDGILPSKVLSRHTQSELDLHEFIYKDMKQKFIEGLDKFYPLKEVEVALQTIKTKLCLNTNDFDARGDYYFKTKKGEKLTRGGMVYYQPSQKWKRFGLRVLGVYENDDWIKMDGNPNEWVVAYHGTRNTGERGLECMMKRRGSFDAYGGQTPTNRNDKIPQLGIYFAQNVEDCFKTPIELNGKRYEVAFQCRIHPDHVWITGNRSFIVVDNPNYVRPYGILLKKMETKKK